MNAAVLCPGPSLARLIRADLAGTAAVIGVNRAPVIVEPMGVRCHWWAFSDRIFLDDVALWPSNTCGWLISDSLADELNPAPDIVLYRDLFEFAPRKLGWTVFTATAALVLAASQGAQRIDVYGADWSPGGADADGVMLPGTRRDADRWRCEAAVWRRLCAWLADERGVTVERKQPKQ